tara:strand:+ start:278 stop:538 length:261 start_codon:yes stop_codon:yes gene_type:complete
MEKIKIKKEYKLNVYENYVKLKTTSGHEWITPINGTFESIQDYFFKDRFNVGDYPDEIMERVTNLDVYEKNTNDTILIASFQNQQI